MTLRQFAITLVLLASLALVPAAQASTKTTPHYHAVYILALANPFFSITDRTPGWPDGVPIYAAGGSVNITGPDNVVNAFTVDVSHMPIVNASGTPQQINTAFAQQIVPQVQQYYAKQGITVAASDIDVSIVGGFSLTVGDS